MKKIYVGMKFRFKGLCSDHDEEIIEITEHSVVTKSLTLGKYLTRFDFKEFDSEGYPIHRYHKEDFLLRMNPRRCYAITPYVDDKRF
jgi:hypothetical protein